MCSRVSCCILSLLLLPLIHAALHNVTIDDTFGDLVTGAVPTYVPDPWQHSDCSGCAIKPPLAHVFKQTYSAFTFDPEKLRSMSIQFAFQGSAIFVYFILPNFVGTGITTETLCNFTLDGKLVSTFHHIPSTSRDYIFNALVFSKENLPGNDSHTLLISTSGLDRDVFTSFDYAIYQFDDGLDGTTSQPSPTTTLDVVTVTPQTSTTIVSGTPVVTTISSTLTQAELASSNAISSSRPNLSPSAAVVTSGTRGTTGTAGTVLATPSSSGSTGDSQSSDNVDNDKAPVGAIAGGVVGGIALIFLLILVIFLCCRRRQAPIDLASNIDGPAPRHPVLIPFTSPAPGDRDTEDRSIEGRSPFTQFTPVRKQQRDGAQMRELENYRFPAAHGFSSSEVLGAEDRSTISEQIDSLRKRLDMSDSSASGLGRFGGSDVTEMMRQNQAMKAEIERLQVQLNSDRALGLMTEAPPRYGDIHRLTSSAAPVAIP